MVATVAGQEPEPVVPPIRTVHLVLVLEAAVVERMVVVAAAGGDLIFPGMDMLGVVEAEWRSTTVAIPWWLARAHRV
jgi:hypothetical protein